MDTIVIIGGGAAGASVFGELLQCEPRLAVHWVSGSLSPGRGVAYATQNAQHLLNVRAARMGLLSSQRQGFVEYAAHRDASIRGTDFLPRRMFGDFIQAQIDACMERAEARGVDFQLHHQEAAHVERLPDGRFVVHLWNGLRIQARYVVLAIGALPPRPLRCVSPRALAMGRYVLDPWSPGKQPQPPRKVLVIGTGLTAVDTVLTAAKRWPRAALTAVSRHGRLPFTHPRDPLAPFPGQAALNERLLRSRGPLDMLRAVRSSLAAHPSSDWRALVDGMRTVNAGLWQTLSLPQRRQFLRHLRWLWEAGRHRMAPGTAEAMQRLLEENRLQVHAARVLAVEGGTRLSVHVRHRASQAADILQADLVIQATGLDTTAAYTRHALMGQLIEDGLVRPDPLRLGLVALADGRLVGGSGQVTDGLYAIGALLRGSLWECTAMSEIRIAAQELARDMSERAAAPAPATPVPQ